MIRSLQTQTLEFLLSGALGILLGLAYDMGRAQRRIFPKLTVPVDLGFALLFFLSLLLTAVYTGGLKLYQLLGLFLGSALWFCTLSPPVLRAFSAVLIKIRQLGKGLRIQAKKSLNFLRKLIKKFFPSSGKWSTIGVIPFSPKGKGAKRKGAASHGKKHIHKALRRNHGGVGRMESRDSGQRASDCSVSGPSPSGRAGGN